MSQTLDMISLTIRYVWKRLVLAYASSCYVRDQQTTTYESFCYRCWGGRLKQATIKRSLHSACVPLIDSPCFFVTVAKSVVNIGLCHEMSHRNNCRRGLCGIERGTKKHVWFFLKFERYKAASSLATVTVHGNFVRLLCEVRRRITNVIFKVACC